jgi:hypothetical protein
LSLQLVAFCHLLSLAAQLVFNERFAILDRARVTPYFKGVFMARQNLADGCAESRETVTRWTRNIWQDILRNASLVLTALLCQLLTLLSHRVANRVANFVASDVASRDYHPVANPVAPSLLITLPTLLRSQC